MIVRIEGAFSPIQGDLFDEFIRFALFKIMGNDSLDLDITVKITGDVISDHRWADVKVVQIPGEPPEQYPSKFVIRVYANTDIMKQLKMLGHELTHVKQFAMGELVILEDDQTQWHDTIVDNEDFDPGFEPWEIECRGMEWCLVESFVALMQYNMKGWYYASV